MSAPAGALLDTDGAAPAAYLRVERSLTGRRWRERCGDGLLIAVHMSSREKFWTALLEVLDAPELGRDPRFTTRMNRIENYRVLRRELGDRFARQPRAAWIERLSTVDIPFGPVNALLDALEDPQVATLGTVYEVENSVGNVMTGIQPPILVNGRRPIEMRPAPELGENHMGEYAQHEG